MPGQIITQANPPPDQSHLPKELEKLAVKFDTNVLSEKEVLDLRNFRAAANYIAAGGKYLFYGLDALTCDQR
jgi:xylulose-5-phosphate/fructose-6-phosphate phosphoketolase